MGTRKLLIIGIDGMDPVLLDRFCDRLPNLRSLQETTGAVQYESVFPPDSVPAWVSFFTGLNPAEHGVMEYVDQLAPAGTGGVAADRFRGRTFWDLAGQAGKRVMIVNPFLAYPPWPVSGIMASGPAFVQGEVRVDPQDDALLHPLPFMGGYSEFPGESELAKFFDQAERDTRELADYAGRVWEDLRPDLAFVSFLTLDRIQHFLWRYSDPQDPTYPGRTGFTDAVFRFYVLLDEIVGSLRAMAGQDVATLVMSDHGHGRRCTRLININEILRREGLLACQGAAHAWSGRRLIERMKNAALTYAHRWHLEKLLQRAAKRIPNKKAFKRGDHIIDKERSLAFLSDFDGANPFGGICLTAAATSRADREALITRLLELLRELHHSAGLPRPVVRWAKRREQIYSGTYLNKYPEVVFELDPDFGVNWSLFAPAVVPNPRHRTLSGGHLKPGVLLVSGRDMSSALRSVETPMTLFQHVLDWMGLNAGN